MMQQAPKAADPKVLCRELATIWLETNAVILDTETTGLDDKAEIVEISAIDCTGKVLMNQMVKPRYPIPLDAMAIHGISNDMVMMAPVWPTVYDKLRPIIERANAVVIFNAPYDTRLIQQTNALYDLPGFNIPASCAMRTYASYWGEWDDRRKGFKWQNLVKAAHQQRVTVDGNAHRALTDCYLTLGIIQAMAGRQEA